MKDRRILTPVILVLACLIIEMAFSMLLYRNVLSNIKNSVLFSDVMEKKKPGLTVTTGKGINKSETLNGELVFVVSKQGGTITLEGDAGVISSVAFETRLSEGMNAQLAKCTVSVVTSDTPSTVQTLSTYQFAASDGETTKILFGKTKNVTKLQISFAASKSDYQVLGLGMNNVTPRFFSVGRFVLLLIVAFLGYLIVAGRVWNVIYDPKVDWHRYVYAGVEGFSILLVFWVYFALLGSNVKTDITYPLDRVENEQCYVQQFDAFMKKRLSLDVTPTPELMALENPYDNGQREGVYYLWDRAYYNGQYYSYFGAAPVFLVYYPYYFLFHKVPAAGKVMLIYAILGVVALFGVIRRLISIFKLRANMLLLCLGSLSLVFCSGLLLMLRGWASVYYIASLAGLTSMLMFIWAALCACQAEKTRKALGLFLLAGVLLVVTVASRVNHAVMGILFVAPFFIRYLREDRSIEKKVNAVLYFLVPALMGAVLVCTYNMARFGSPIEFGSNYQLTVSDVRQNHIALDRVLPSVFHSFLQPARVTMEFPQVQFLYTKLSDYGYYVYVDSNMGVYMYPLVFASLFSIFLFFGGKKEDKAVVFGHRVYLVALVSAFLVSLLNFSVGGVHFRYTYDFCVILGLTGLLSTLEGYSYTSESTAVVRKSLFGVLIAVFGITLFVGYCLLVNEYNGNFVSYAPSYWAHLKDFFVR